MSDYKVLSINQSQVREVAHNIISEMIKERQVRNEARKRVRRIMSETIHRLCERQRFNEEKEEDGKMGEKRKAVMNMLKDEKYDHATLAYSLWHPKNKSEEDTYRSLFSKKANGTPDADGSVRSFNEDEINKLYELLRAH